MSSRFLNISTDNTLGGGSASDEIVSSQKAIKDYVDSQTSGSYANTDLSNLTSTGKSTGASLSFPSSTYDNLVWNANPNTQTATANGVMWLDGVTTTTSQFVSASVRDSNNNLKYTVINWYPASNGFAFMIPVAKGDVVTWQAGPNQLGSVTNFRFIYAQGEI